jgi:hypothetical protein
METFSVGLRLELTLNESKIYSISRLTRDMSCGEFKTCIEHATRIDRYRLVWTGASMVFNHIDDNYPLGKLNIHQDNMLRARVIHGHLQIKIKPWTESDLQTAKEKLLHEWVAKLEQSNNELKNIKMQLEFTELALKFEQKERLKNVEELQNIREASLCRICLDKDGAYLFDSCGHASFCGTCVSKLAEKLCPICRCGYEKTIKIFYV